MSWTVEVGAPNPFTISAHMNFQLRTQSTWNDDGKPLFVETFIELQGDIIKAPPSDVADDTVDLRNQTATILTSRDVTIKLDGVQKFQFLKTASIGSPRVEFHQTIDEEGAGDSHWPYTMQIYVKQPVSGTTVEIETSLKIIKEGKKIVRKIWAASVKAKTIADALATAKGFKPNDKHLHEEIERQFQQRRVNALWVWTTRKKGSVTEVIEDAIQITQLGNVFIASKQVGKPNKLPPNAVLHQGRLNAFKILVSGVVRGQSPKEVQAAIPAEHFSESNTLKRNRGEEANDLTPHLIDPILGIHEMRYQEVWIGTDTDPPTPDHGGHKPKDPPECINPPADGAMAAQGS